MAVLVGGGPSAASVWGAPLGSALREPTLQFLLIRGVGAPVTVVMLVLQVRRPPGQGAWGVGGRRGGLVWRGGGGPGRLREGGGRGHPGARKGGSTRHARCGAHFKGEAA
jgi:hypothetical protein